MHRTHHACRLALRRGRRAHPRRRTPPWQTVGGKISVSSVAHQQPAPMMRPSAPEHRGLPIGSRPGTVDIAITSSAGSGGAATTASRAGEAVAHSLLDGLIRITAFFAIHRSAPGCRGWRPKPSGRLANIGSVSATPISPSGGIATTVANDGRRDQHHRHRQQHISTIVSGSTTRAPGLGLLALPRIQSAESRRGDMPDGWR